MAGIDWFRWHHGSVTDPKFQLVARRSGARVGDVIAVWAFVLEAASSNADRGAVHGLDHESIDCLLGAEEGTTRKIECAMIDRGLIAEGRVSSWDKRQPKRERDNDNSSGRVKVFREKRSHETPCNATKRQETPREEKSREESTSSLRSDVVSALPADDEPQRKTSGTPKRATQLPDDFEPDDTAAALAVELGVSLTAELPKFRDYHAARGKPMKDWQAAMRTWLRNAKQFAKPSAKQTESERRAAWLADITGRKGDAIDAPARLVG